MKTSWAAGVQGLHQMEGEGGLSGVKNEKEPPTEKKWSPREREPQVQTLRVGRAGSTGRRRSVWPEGDGHRRGEAVETSPRAGLVRCSEAFQVYTARPGESQETENLGDWISGFRSSPWIPRGE